MLTLSRKDEATILAEATQFLGERLLYEGDHFTDGWHAMFLRAINDDSLDRLVDVNVWLEINDSVETDDEDDEDQPRVYNISVYEYDTENQELITESLIRVGSIIIRKESK